uniref:Uncharacterized protein n=1 Tax=Parastrongyloides trichosuri TaxID=131310 RepID=A0A0N4ZL29_PARTI
MKANLKILFAILFINLLTQNQVKAWIKCWGRKVSMNMELSFQTSRDDINATVKDIDINIYETQLFGRYISSILTIVKNENTNFNIVISTRAPTSIIYGFSVYGEVSYKISCKNSKHQNKLCDKTMKFHIPDACLSCYDKPQYCLGAVNLDIEHSWIRPSIRISE